MDGVYDKDPLKFPDAVMYPEVSYHEVLSKALGVMDATAVAMCRDNQLPIIVFNLNVARQYNANGDGRARRHPHPLSERSMKTEHATAAPSGQTFNNRQRG